MNLSLYHIFYAIATTTTASLEYPSCLKGTLLKGRSRTYLDIRGGRRVRVANDEGANARQQVSRPPNLSFVHFSSASETNVAVVRVKAIQLDEITDT